MKTADRVVRCVAASIGVDAAVVKHESVLIEELGIDSLGLLELAMAIEEEFQVEIEDEDIERCKTVADVVALAERVVCGVAA